MRSTAGAGAPSGSRFRKWLLAVTPSLKTLTELPVRIVIGVRPAGALLRQPHVEARGDEAVRALLALGGADREVVGVLVLGVSGMALDPLPGDRVRRRGLDQLLPEL